MKKKALIKKPNGQTIDATHNGRSGAKSIIIFVHGFPKAQAQDNNFFEILAEKIPSYGASSLLFDYSSCNYENGKTEGFSFASAKEDLSAVYSWVKKMGYDHIGIIAEGLGAPLVTSSSPESCILGIFLWPAFDLKHVCEGHFQSSTKKEELENQGWLEHDGVKIGSQLIKDLETTNLNEGLMKFTAPTIILYGELDDIFPSQHVEIAREHLMAQRLEITTFDGAEHGLKRSNDRKSCLLHISQFIKRYVTS